MIGDKLHEFDLELCEYAVGILSYHLHKPSFAEWVKQNLPPPMLRYLAARREDENQPRLLLDDDEFYSLMEAAKGDPSGATPDWVPDPYLHKRSVYCVKEIRAELTRQDAEEWSVACKRFGKLLQGKSVRLDEGIEIVQEWVHHVRRLLRAMEAAHYLPYPEGSLPTPTNPAMPITATTGSASVPTLDNRDLRDIERLRRAIANGIKGRKTTPDALIKAAHINNQRGRRLLRWLEANGEYDGFGRKQADRFKEGRRNER